jgi:peptidoglycan hydrolase-like protein with peptidoglycan-binding domain
VFEQQQVYIPAYIKVHLGAPDKPAEDVTVPFLTYVKNVASSEIYPTWPENSIRANMFAQITFVLNRIYTEYYPSRGHDFDITNSPDYDQAFVYNRGIFSSIEDIGNEIFNDYLRRIGSTEPMFARYCDGRVSTCDGLSQWGSLDLALKGLTAYQILQNYYGNDIEIIENAAIMITAGSYPGYPQKRGAQGEQVARIQTQLRRISGSYPSIPKIEVINGIFDEATEISVKRFQNIFELKQDGIVEKKTWYKLLYIYVAIKKLADVHSEGEAIRKVPKEFGRTLELGMKGQDVNVVQFLINNMSSYNPAIPGVQISNIFNEETKDAVMKFQKYKGYAQTGIVDQVTFESLYNEYRGTMLAHQAIFREKAPRAFPGYVLRLGTTGKDVQTIQMYLLALSRAYSEIPKVQTNSVFDEPTEKAVRAFQKKFSMEQTGIVDKAVWNRIAEEYSKVKMRVASILEIYPECQFK